MRSPPWRRLLQSRRYFVAAFGALMLVNDPSTCSPSHLRADFVPHEEGGAPCRAPRSAAVSVRLARYAKVVVAMTLVLVVIGGHTTTSGAGMAFADWPLSHGSVNPDDWWQDFMQRLEHGHRLAAETVGLMVGVLCAWVWRSAWGVPIAAGVSVAAAVIAKLAGAPPVIVAHVGLWTSAATFALVILARARRGDHHCTAMVRWLAFAAFLGVCVQAVLGGLRVTVESAGDPQAATALRIVHGCFAQGELCALVCIAAMLSPVWVKIAPTPEFIGIRRLGWITAGIVFLQLIAGATMRHLGAGLAIPTFPQMPAGGWMPAGHDVYTDLNFTHTRIGAVLVSLFVLALVLRAIGNAAGDVRIIRPAALLLALIAAQVTLGIFVVWQMRPPILTTLHVVNGAAVLATTVLLAIRARSTPRRGTVPTAQLAEVPA